jgi:hypothetical protein
MIKDPFHQEETPYELLKLEPFVSQNEVHSALPRFMKDKKNIPKLGKAQEAIKKLNNPRVRMAIDILYYNIGNIEIENVGKVDIQSIIDSLISVPRFPEEEFYIDLKKKNYSDDIMEIKERKIVISDITKYDDLETMTMNTALLPFDV